MGDVVTAREEKLRDGVQYVLASAKTDNLPSAIELTNVGAMEVNSLRAGFLKVRKYSLLRAP